MIRPTENRILVKLDESLPTEAVIYLAPIVDKWREADDQIGNRGTVVAVGPGKMTRKGVRMPMSVAPGDIIRFSELEYHAEKTPEGTFVIINEMDIEYVEEQENAA